MSHFQLRHLPVFCRAMEVPAEAQKLADEKDFEIKMYRIGAGAEQLRPPRLVRVAVVQNSIVRPTTDPVKDQVGGCEGGWVSVGVGYCI